MRWVLVAKKKPPLILCSLRQLTDGAPSSMLYSVLQKNFQDFEREKRQIYDSEESLLRLFCLTIDPILTHQQPDMFSCMICVLVYVIGYF